MTVQLLDRALTRSERALIPSLVCLVALLLDSSIAEAIIHLHIRDAVLFPSDIFWSAWLVTLEYALICLSSSKHLAVNWS